MSKELEKLNLAYQAGTDLEDVDVNTDIVKENVLNSKIESSYPKVKRYVASSDTNKEIVKNDLDNLNILERTAKNIKSTWSYSDEELKLNKNYFDLGMAKTYPFLSAGKPDEVYNEIQSLENTLKSKEDYTGDSVFQKTVSGFTSIAAGMVDTVKEHPAIVGTAATAGGVSALAGAGVFSLGTAIAGGTAAAFPAFRAASAFDQFKASGGMVVREAINSEYANKLTKEQVADAALLVGTAGAALDFGFIGGVGKLSKVKDLGKFKDLLSPKAVLKGILEGSPEVLTKVGVVKEALKSGGINGLQDAVQKLGTLWAAEGGELKADKVFTGSNAIDLGVSTFTGTAFAGGMGAFSLYRQSKKDVAAPLKETLSEQNKYTEPEVPKQVDVSRVQLSEKSVRSLERVSEIKDYIKKYKETESKLGIKDTVALNELQKEFFDGQVAYIHPEDIDGLDPKFIDAYKNITGKELSKTDTNQIPMEILMKVSDEQGQIFDHVAIRPEDESAGKVLKFKADMDKNAEDYVKLTKRLEVETDPDTIASLRKEINDVQSQMDFQVKSVEDAAQLPVVPDSMKDSLDPEVYKDLVETQTKVAEQISGKLESENQTKIDLETQAIQLEEMDMKLLDIDKSPVIELTKKFESDYQLTPDVGAKIAMAYPDLDLNAYLTKEDRKGSLIAINPDTLPQNLKDMVKDPDLKKHGVFSKDGLSWDKYDQIAVALGFKNKDRLIEGLKKSMTREEFTSQQLDKDYGMIRKEVERINSLTREDYLKAYEDVNNTTRKQINLLLKEKTGTAKKMIRQLGKDFNNIDKIKDTAIYTADNLSYKELNPNVFRRNTKRHLLEAAKNLAKGDFLGFFSAKEKQQLNTLLEGEVKYRKLKVDTALKKVTRILSKKENADIISRAGENYANTLNALKNLIEFNPRKNLEPAQQLKDYITELRNSGAIIKEFDSSILDNTKVSINDMSLKQVELVTSLINDVFEQAKRKDLMKTVAIENERQRTVLKASNDIYIEQSKKKNFTKDLESEKRKLLKDSQGNIKIGTWDRYKSFTGQHSIYADYLGPQYSKYVYDPIVKGQMTEGKLTTLTYDMLNKASLTVKDFNKMTREFVQIPELSSKYKNGEVSKATLFQMLLNMGNEGNREALVNTLGLDIDKIDNILKTHLDESHKKAVYEIAKVYEVLNKERKALHKRNNTSPAEDIRLGKVKIMGEESEGFYYPIQNQKKLDVFLQSNDVSMDVQDMLKGTFKHNENPLDSHVDYYSDISREGAGDRFELSLDHNVTKHTIDQSIRAISYTEPLSDVMGVLANPKVQESVSANVGREVFENVLVKSIVNQVKGSPDDIVQSNIVLKSLNKVMSNFGASRLMFNVGSVAKQIASVPMMVSNLKDSSDLGFLKSSKYLADAFLSISDLDNFRETYNQIARLSPEFADKSFMSLDNAVRSLHGDLDEFYGFHGGRFDQIDQSKLNDLHKKFKAFGMSFLTSVGAYLNTAQYMASFNMALEGKVKGVNAGDKSAAILHAEKMVTKSLEANSQLNTANFTKDPTSKMLTGMFANQANVLFQQSLIGGKLIRDGEYKRGVYKILPATILNTLAAGYIGSMVKEIMFGDEKEVKYPHEDVGNTVMDALLGNAVIGRDFAQIWKLKDYERMNKNYPSPVISLLADATNTVSGISGLISDGRDLNRQEVRALGNALTGGFGVPFLISKEMGEETSALLSMIRDIPSGIDLNPESPEAKALEAIKSTSNEELKDNPQGRAIIDSAVRKAVGNTPKDNPSQNVLGDYILKPREYKAVKISMELTNLQMKKEYGQDFEYLSDDEYNAIRKSSPELKLPESKSRANQRQLFGALWKINEGIVNSLKTRGLEIEPKYLHIGRVLGDRFEQFLDLKYSDSMDDFTDLGIVNGMTKGEYLDQINSEINDNTEDAIKVLTEGR